ncbi:preprotein translocase subunit YajC [Bacteroidota bacterium]
MNVLCQVMLYTDPSGKGGGFSSLLFLFMIIAVFYFFMIRPQMKKSKDLKKFREAIKKGDKVVTIGGIHGKIAEIKDTTIIIEVEGQNRLKIEKSAIAMEGQGGQLDKK